VFRLPDLAFRADGFSVAEKLDKIDGKAGQSAGEKTASKRLRVSVRSGVMRLAEPRWAAFILLVISVALYANTLGYAFVWDDVSLIATNRAVRTLDARAIGRIFTEGFAEVEGRQESYYPSSRFPITSTTRFSTATPPVSTPPTCSGTL